VNGGATEHGEGSDKGGRNKEWEGSRGMLEGREWRVTLRLEERK